MKKLLPGLAAAVLLLGSIVPDARGQTEEADILFASTGTVIVPLQLRFMDGRTSLNFDLVGGPINRTLSSGQRMRSVLPGAMPHVPAEFEVSGDARDWIVVTVPASFLMYHIPVVGQNPAPGQNTTMMANVRLFGHAAQVNGRDEEANMHDFDYPTSPVSTAPVMLSSDAQGDGVEGDALGQIYIKVGGVVQASNNQQRGEYAGSFNILIDYAP